MEEEIKKRQKAIELWLQNKPIKVIVAELGRSRQWFYKWLKRYNQRKDETTWFLSASRAPKSNKRKVSDELEDKIIAIRKKLMGQKYCQTGAISIQYELYSLGLPVPPIWTINRIIAKHDLVQRPSKISKKGLPYPDIYIGRHQMDIVGPRYLQGGYRFYVLNIIDVETHFVHIHPVLGKSAQLLVQGIITFWKQFGLPDSLQMDNELTFRGSNRHPRSLGLILRFILSQNVVPVFIPQGEPWRNGIVEKFNDVFDKKFFRVQHFTDFEHLKTEAKAFCEFHNQNHRYSTQENKTPLEMQALIGTSQKLDANYQIPEKIDLEEGLVIFVRFVRSDLKVKILGTEFTVKQELMYSYIVAELVIDIHTLRIKQDNIVHHVFEFIMPVDW